jgi:quercetin dioxygenase-like cupin family protein
MDGKFITATAMERDHLDWGIMGWLSRPATTGAKDLVVIEVTLEPGCGHNFHKHPGQEEVIYVVAGAVEQWVGRESTTLRPGDGVFIGADVVHASFNTGSATAKLIAILGPSVGAEGYQLVEVYEQEPWASLRK